MREINKDTFKIDTITDTATGSWNPNTKQFNICYSSILSKLISEAGRWCISYSSDLFIDWYYLMNRLHDYEMTSEKLVFGFREQGVDGLNYILSKLNNGYSKDHYRSIWVLDIKIIETDCSWGKDIDMALGKILL